MPDHRGPNDEQAPPLDGVNVLDLSQMIAGPGAAMLLAEYGASVLKVEPPSGDGGRALRTAAAAEFDPPPMFSAFNRNKTATRLDLKDPDDVDRVWRLIADADVVIESSMPGAMERLGFGADAVLDRHPQLVYASVSGFGWGTEGRRRRGVDLIVQAESGIMSTTGQRGGQPTKVGFTVVDAACAHALCHGVLAALFRRERTGLGGVVRISLYDVALNLQTGPLAEFMCTGVPPERFGNSAAHTSPADLYRCSDGEIVLAAYLDAHWQKLLDVLDADGLRADPLFASPQLRVQNRDVLNELLSRLLATNTTDNWHARFLEAGLLVAKANDYRAVLADSLCAESGVVVDEPDLKSVRNAVAISGLTRVAAEPMRTVGSADLRFAAEPLYRGTARTAS